MSNATLEAQPDLLASCYRRALELAPSIRRVLFCCFSARDLRLYRSLLVTAT